MQTYQKFLSAKHQRWTGTGDPCQPQDLPDQLYPFQRAVTAWSVRKGRSAIFADCGLGKTFMELAWAAIQPGPVLILAPLCVGEQTINEGKKIGIEVSRDTSAANGIQITNYERIHQIDVGKYQAVVLDESSILKSLDGKTRTKLIALFQQTPRRLCCTATPAPNDIAELANHAEFLGVMTRAEMLATFFVHDETGWRIKGHAKQAFYRWLASWACFFSSPSDLGFEQPGFDLPELRIHQHVVSADGVMMDRLPGLSLGGIKERLRARQQTIETRSETTYKLIDPTTSQWLVWCGLNDEGDRLEHKLTNAIQIAGRHDENYKETVIQWFLGTKCICSDSRFRDKLQSWQRAQRNIGSGIISNTENHASQKISDTSQNIGTSVSPIIANTTKSININGNRERESSAINITQIAGIVMPLIAHSGIKLERKSGNGKKQTQPSVSTNGSKNTESPERNTNRSLLASMENVPFVETERQTKTAPASMLTTAMTQGLSVGSSAPTATLELENLTTTQNSSTERSCICGHQSGRRILISKSKLTGFGLNLQQCSQMVFMGIGDSYEQYYQAIRRCWRYGQQNPVDVHIVVSDVEQDVLANVQRKEREAMEVMSEMVKEIAIYEQDEIGATKRHTTAAKKEAVIGEAYALHHGDCIEEMANLPAASIDFSVYSPPFMSLYTYTDSSADLGNCRSDEQFIEHFGYFIKALLRVTKPGRLTACHVAQVPAMLVRDGYIGLKDFRGKTIEACEAAGWIFHGEVAIDKNPQAQAIRTKAKSLLFKQLRTDSSWLRPALCDFLLLFRAPGENTVPVLPDVDNETWITWAHGVWYDIRESDTLRYMPARDEEDERHICPLQLGLIERAIRLWSNPGETVLSPFMGIGSEGVVAMQTGRRFVGIELKDSYYRLACQNIAEASRATSTQGVLFA